ncbi:MAG: DUF1573 domain-containing protein [Candidatus Hydrogenedentes bacterium]|nr:DUF1573 domain-containing protein [Candidatus Hydrogenedentota bacterium]
MSIRIFVFVLLAAFAQSCGSRPAEETSKSPAAAKPARGERRTTVFEFGSVRQAAIVKHTFQVTNTGKEPVTVTRVQSTCGCTVADVEKNTVIEPGKSLDVPVQLKTRGKHNPIESKVIVNYAGNVPPDELILKGTAAEEYPITLEIPEIKRGEQPEQTITLATFAGQPPLAITDMKFDPAKFEVASKPGSKEGTIDITVKPSVSIAFGSVNDQLVINTNDTETPEKTILLRAHVKKPLQAATRQLVLLQENDKEPVSGTVDFMSPYGAPITDVATFISREKRFKAEIETGAPENTVRVKVTALPSPKGKTKSLQATLKITAKVGGEEAEERMNVILATSKEAAESASKVDVQQDHDAQKTAEDRVAE